MLKLKDEGVNFLKEQIKYLVKYNQLDLDSIFIDVVAAKYLGFRLGLIQNKLPILFKKGFSLNTNFWYKRS